MAFCHATFVGAGWVVSDNVSRCSIGVVDSRINHCNCGVWQQY